jgi:hypothetical protein
VAEHLDLGGIGLHVRSLEEHVPLGLEAGILTSLDVYRRSIGLTGP